MRQAGTDSVAGAAPSSLSVSRTCAARPSASSRSSLRRSATEPWSTKRSPGIPIDPDRHVAQRRVGQPCLLDRLEHAGPEAAADDALLERDHEPLAARLFEDQLAVERLREPGVDDADRPAVARPAARPPRARARRSARTRRTAGRAPRARPRPARSAGRPARPSAGRTPRRAGSGARTGGPARAPSRSSDRSSCSSFGDAITRFGSWRCAGSVNIPWWLVPSSPTSPARSTASSTG